MAVKLKVKVGDTVKVIAGTDKNKKDNTGKVQKVFVKKHQKPRGQGLPGGIIEKEAPISASNVMVICPKCGKPTRIGHVFIEGEGKQSRRKRRVCKQCKAVFDN